MATSVGVNKLSIVNADTNGTSPSFPDPCKTPTPGGPVPIPYPNIARSSDSAKITKKVKVDGKGVCNKGSNFSTSTGDEAGTAGGGVVSNKTKGKAEFVNVSFDVQFEGKGAARSFDIMLHNNKNTPPFPVLQGPVIGMGKSADKPKCLICDKEIG
jgi:hypothetical protein